MSNKEFSNQPMSGESYSALIRDLTSSFKDLARSELALAKEEARTTAKRLVSHSLQMAIFTALLVVSIFPLLAFLVIGLGDLMDGRYWLSSLIVGLACAGIGGVMAYRSLQKIKTDDLSLPLTRETLKRESELIKHQVHNIGDSTKKRAI